MPPRSKIELLGLLELVIEYYERDKLSLRDIEKRLKTEGYDISRSSVQRSLKSYKDVAEQYKRSLEEASMLIETVKNNPNTDVLETATSLMAGKFLDYAKSLDSVDFEDPVKFSEALARMARAQVSMGRLRMEYAKGFDAARDRFLKELAVSLQDSPEMLISLRSIVEKMQPPA